MIQALGRYLLLKSALSSSNPRLPVGHIKKKPPPQSQKIRLLLFEILSNQHKLTMTKGTGCYSYNRLTAKEEKENRRLICYHWIQDHKAQCPGACWQGANRLRLDANQNGNDVTVWQPWTLEQELHLYAYWQCHRQSLLCGICGILTQSRKREGEAI